MGNSKSEWAELEEMLGGKDEQTFSLDKLSEKLYWLSVTPVGIDALIKEAESYGLHIERVVVEPTEKGHTVDGPVMKETVGLRIGKLSDKVSDE